jgi:hypothetical protein
MWLAQPNGGHFSIATAVFMNEIAQPPPGNPANVTPIGDCKASNAQAATRVRHETVSRAAATRLTDLHASPIAWQADTALVN